MPSRVVRVTAPSRLHFGLFSFGQPDTRQYGGLGVMVDRPTLALTVSESPRFVAEGPHAERVADCVEHLRGSGWLTSAIGVRITVERAPPAHAGLGSGTQLALSVATALNAWLNRAPCDAIDLARATGRGQRSAIGVHGFLHGGLLVEAGKLSGDTLGPLVARRDLPDEWRFVLVTLDDAAGLSGDAERRAFETLPAVPSEKTDELCRTVLLDLLPAVAGADFARASEALYRYGRLAGSCFASQQGGAYGSPRLAAVVDAARELGFAGAAQSSWGPTIAVLAPSETAAKELGARLVARDEFLRAQMLIAAPANRGALIEFESVV